MFLCKLDLPRQNSNYKIDKTEAVIQLSYHHVLKIAKDLSQNVIKICCSLVSKTIKSLSIIWNFLLPGARVYLFTTTRAFPCCRRLLELAAQFPGIATWRPRSRCRHEAVDSPKRRSRRSFRPLRVVIWYLSNLKNFMSISFILI